MGTSGEALENEMEVLSWAECSGLGTIAWKGKKAVVRLAFGTAWILWPLQMTPWKPQCLQELLPGGRRWRIQQTEGKPLPPWLLRQPGGSKRLAGSEALTIWFIKQMLAVGLSTIRAWAGPPTSGDRLVGQPGWPAAPQQEPRRADAGCGPPSLLLPDKETCHPNLLPSNSRFEHTTPTQSLSWTPPPEPWVSRAPRGLVLQPLQLLSSPPQELQTAGSSLSLSS